ncbi:hypothetical protein Tco_0863926 [Tanacetum coccineum]
MAETMEQYMSKTRTDYGSGVARPKIDNKDQFELKGQFLKELRENTFSRSDNEDANENIDKVLKIVDLFHILNITENQLTLQVFLISLTRAASCCFQQEPDETLYQAWERLTLDEISSTLFNRDAGGKSTETFDGIAAIQAQLNNLGREIKKVNEKVYVAQVDFSSYKKKKGKP